jgi:N-acetylglucosamine kinase-like BadF-type ATPase
MVAVPARRRSKSGRPATWSIGVDLGGTWIRVLACDARGRRRAIRAASPGVGGLAAFLAHAWARWGVRKRDVGALVVASRGVWTRAERRRLASRLGHLSGAVQAISDTEAAYLGALGDRPGVLLLAGTGSMALGRDDRGRWQRAGGLGPLLGDEGSAFWIGREWLRASVSDADFGRTRRILRAPDPAARIAALAPEVLRQARTSPRARAIVRRGQRALADAVAATARRLRLRAPIRVSWGGSLLDAPDYRAGVWREAGRRGLRLDPQPPESPAIEAASRLAQALAGDTRAVEMETQTETTRVPGRRRAGSATRAGARRAGAASRSGAPSAKRSRAQRASRSAIR